MKQRLKELLPVIAKLFGVGGGGGGAERLLSKENQLKTSKLLQYVRLTLVLTSLPELIIFGWKYW